MTRKYYLAILLMPLLLSCTRESSKPLTGNDFEDVTDTKWLHRENKHAHFFYFDNDNTNGWEAEVDNAEEKSTPFLSKKDFKYSLDTISQEISIFYVEGDSEKVFKYTLEYDKERKLVLNGIMYEDGQYEIDRYDSRMWNTIGQGADAAASAVQLYQDYTQ